MHPIHQLANTISPISNTSFEKISHFLHERTIKKGTILCNINETAKYGYFIKSGIISSSINFGNGKTFVRGLYIKNQLVGPHPSLVANVPSSFIYETLNDCVVIEYEFEKIRDLYYENPDLLRFGYKVLEQFYLNLEETIISLGTRDAKDRYLEFRETYAEVENAIPLQLTASYLGITPIQLSRIRKSLKEEGLL